MLYNNKASNFPIGFIVVLMFVQVRRYSTLDIDTKCGIKNYTLKIQRYNK